jgi:Sel1 repeat
MGQRFSLDSPSFEQFLAAASFLQQIQKQAARNGVRDFQFAQPLLELVETQHAIEAGSLGLDTAIARIVGLSMKVVGATGAAAWLFTQNEFVFCAGAGTAARDDDRLRLHVLAKLAGSCQLHGDPPLAFSSSSSRYDDEGYYPGSMKSMLVAPIYQGRDIAGALAACSPELEVFDERDATNLRLLAGLIAHALTKTAAAGLKQSMALERVAMLKVIHRIMPALQQLVDEQTRSRDIAHNMPEENSADILEEEVFEDSAAYQSCGPSAVLNSCQKTFDELPLEPITTSSTSAESSENDISLPFVGVRAALGNDLVEESHLWATFVNALAWPGRRLRAGLVSFFQGLAWELEGLRDAAGHAGGRVKQTLSYRPNIPRPRLPHLTLPKLPQLNLKQHVLRVSSSLVASSSRAGARLSRLRSSVPKLPARPVLNFSTVKIRHRLLATRIAVHTSIELIQIRGRAVLRRVPEFPDFTIPVPAFPKQVLGQGVSRLRAGLFHVVAQGRAELNFVVRHRPRSRSLRRAAPASAILLVMLAFLISEAGLYHPSQTAVASGRNVSRAALVPEPRPLSLTSPAKQRPESGPTHRQVTDPAVMADIQELSRYELAGIRRLASSGDDYAEFELGMLYETGDGFSQSCTKAAEWVARAAEQGNPAAEYNLGLRYRDGDGVAANPAEAEKWLQKASLHKYSHSKVALASASKPSGTSANR